MLKVTAYALASAANAASSGSLGECEWWTNSQCGLKSQCSI